MIPVGALEYLKSNGLRPLWAAVHARLVRNGRMVGGRLTLTGLNDEEREAVGQFLGQAVGSTHTLKLADLDRQLWESAAGTGLLGVVEAIVGLVPDRRADASVETARRAWLRDQANAALVAAGLSNCPWTSEWLDHLWRHGLPARLPSEEVRRIISQATTTLGLTVGEHGRTWSRGELAQVVTGSAHGLDDDSPLTRLVLRGLALALTGASDYPLGAAERRALWDAAGVTSDTVATTVLTYGLRPLGDDWLRFRADAGAETHLTLREIRRLAPLRLAPQTVYVCENPRVLEAAADAGAAPAIVCTMGNPTTVSIALLDAAVESPDVRLLYHGDFDWPGIAIADRIMRRYNAKPWQFMAADYRRAVAQATKRGTPRQPLTGRARETPWDPALSGAMAQTATAIHEEAVIESLLGDLSRTR
ncbi:MULTISPECIES: TIGR02679 family protein [unclassified Micromonospora]|uniref:TIGR02679 family protein n=1 Tax=unclassified Micromonospora TaxID=2617518 RepID=UPI001C240E94|nr:MULTISPECIES: TIGR02679 family protein [unclassified Micromonospora]MBU8861773.1 TIGR02679 family protein [Micromonospora sp. WMMB482]MDM4781351.1 TIGR02679 family protein [Micromonospora sp. b486]